MDSATPTAPTATPAAAPTEAPAAAPTEAPAAAPTDLTPVYAAISALRDAITSLHDIALDGHNLIHYADVIKVYDDSIVNLDDILRAA